MNVICPQHYTANIMQYHRLGHQSTYNIERDFETRFITTLFQETVGYEFFRKL